MTARRLRLDPDAADPAFALARMQVEVDQAAVQAAYAALR